VEVSTYVRRTYAGSKLYDRIMNDRGGSAINVYDDLSQHPGQINAKWNANHLTEDICFELVCNRGAGLVNRFYVEAAFRHRNKFSYEGQVSIDREKKSDHAMVLVGVRKDATTGKCWLLLQNWWG